MRKLFLFTLSGIPGQMRLSALLLPVLVCWLRFSGHAQVQRPGSRWLEGQVISDSTLEPLVGASVKVVSASAYSGVVTDAAGRFRLHIPDSCTLLVSYLGYQPRKMKVTPGTGKLTVRLAAIEQILHPLTVYTGYQELSGNEITGSYEKIDRKLLDREVSTDILPKLEGKFSGLLFNHLENDQTYLIRGLSTIYGNTQPLIILNDFPYEGDLSNINPNEVESITVLKDAAATSIWGTRAGNGVVVIKTRDAAYNKPLRLDFSASLTRVEKPDLLSLPYMNASDYIDVEEMLFGKGYYNSQINGYDHPVLTPVVELLHKAQQGVISQSEADAQIDAMRAYDVRRDFKKYLYQTGLTQQYFLTLGAGSSNLGYRVSAGYDHNTGVLGVNYERLTVREENRWHPLPRLEITTRVSYGRSESRGGRPSYSSIRLAARKDLYPYARLADDAGNPLPLPQDHNADFIRQAEAQGLLNWQYYPLTDYLYNRPVSQSQDIQLNATAKYRLVDGLSVSVAYQYENTRTPSHTDYTMKSYIARNLINRYTQVNPDGSLTYGIPLGDQLKWSRATLDAYAIRGQLGYKKQFGKSRLVAIAGMEMRQAHQHELLGYFFGYNPKTLSFTPVDYVSYFPQYGIAGSNASIVSGSGLTDIMDRYVSYYFHGTYAYKDRYTLSLSGRKDGSNIFGVSVNQKVVPLWSLGGAWILSAEPFYHVSWMPYLKLRLTDGFSGNVDNSLSALTTINEFSDEKYTHRPYANVRNPPNPSLRWEKVHQINAGIDFGSNHNRLSGSIDYYIKRENDLIGDAPLDPTTGVRANVVSGPFFRFRGNVADMKGFGINVTLHSINIPGAFRWTTDLTFAYQRNKVTRYALKPSYNSQYIGAGYGVKPVVGKPLKSIYSLPWAGLDPQSGDPRGYLNGEITKDYFALLYDDNVDNLKYNGPALPPLFGTLRNTFSYDGLSLSFSLDYRSGSYFFRDAISYSALFSGGTGHADFARRWQQPGDENRTDVPSMVYPAKSSRDAFYLSSSVLVSRGDCIRLRTLDVSYALTSRLCKKLGVRDLGLTLSAKNLGLLWKVKGLDPEYVSRLHPSRTLSAGIKFSF